MGRKAKKKRERKEENSYPITFEEAVEVASEVLAAGGTVNLISPEGKCLSLSLPDHLL